MPEPVSLGLVLAGYAAIQPFARASSAVSQEAQAVRKAACDVVHHAERSQSLFGSKATAISDVWKLADECAENGWDGEEALAIDDMAVAGTVAFIRALPDGIPMPEVAPEPDGSISLDWIQSRHRLFSLTVGGTDRIAYVWLDGADKGHAVARFDGWKTPRRILDGLQSIVNHGNATVRAT
jgi:hypothetical protein